MRLKFFAIPLAILLSAYFGVLLYFAYDLLHPYRMPIQDYQQDWLENPSAHGIQIANYACDAGRTPCLMVAPASQPGAGERGLLLRKQLEEKGLNLKPYGETHGILVLLHGRHGRKEGLLAVAERFAASGFNCVIPDLPAHGENKINLSKFSMGTGEEQIVANVLKDAQHFFNDDGDFSGLWGMSMGGAYATHAAARNPELWQSMVIVASFDALSGVIEDRAAAYSDPFPKFTRHILTRIIRLLGDVDFNQVSPENWAKAIKIPVLVVHGDQDRLIPVSRSERLFNSFIQSAKKQWLVIKGAGHNNILVTEAPVYAEMGSWFLDQAQ